MYIPRSFAMSSDEAFRFMDAHPFAVLAGPGPDGALTATHLPLIVQRLDGDDQRVDIIGHMARANPHWKSLDGQTVLAVFTGPHAYISQAWYPQWPDVPTWNYLAVHALGTLTVAPDREVPALVEELVRFMDPSSPIPEHLDDPVFQRELAAVVGFRIRVTRIEGKQKLGQNRPAVDRLGAADALEASNRPEDREVARLMRDTVTLPSQER